MNKRELLLTAPVHTTVLRISIPIILANLLQTAYSFIDLFWVGRLGTSAVAALGSGFPFLFLLMSIAIGLVSAAGILIAQANGKGSDEQVSYLSAQSLTFIFVVITGLLLIGQLLLPTVLAVVTSDVIVLTLSIQYMRIALISLVPLFVYMTIQTILRSVGEVKLPFYIMLFSVVLNFLLDPLFMNGFWFIPPLGISGVAWVTVFTSTISVCIGLGILASKKYVLLHRKDFSLDLLTAKRLFALGLPTSVEMSSRSLGSLLITGLASTFGTIVLAAYALGGQVFSFVIIPAVGIAIGVATMVGNNLGAGKPQRVQETVTFGMFFGFLFLSVLGIILFITARTFVTFFAPGEVELIATATRFVKFIALTFGCVGAQMAVIGALRASGRTVLSMFAAIGYTLLLFVGAWIFSQFYGATGIWIAYAAANIGSLGIALYFYFKKQWLVLRP